MGDNASFVTSFRANASIGAFLAVGIAGSATSDRLVAVCDTSTSAFVGISNDNYSSDAAVSVTTLGECRAQCGASISAGAIVTWATATGKIVAGAFDTTTTRAPISIGRALEAGTLDAIIKIQLSPSHLASSA